MIISYIPITAISVESGESVVDGSTAGAPIAVPEEGLAISGGTLYGIDKTWFANVNPDKGKIYLAISIPSGVTEINNDGLPYAYGRPDFRPGNTFFKTSEIRSSGEKPTVFAALSFGIVAGNYLSGKPVDPLILALLHPWILRYRQKEEAP